MVVSPRVERLVMEGVDKVLHLVPGRFFLPVISMAGAGIAHGTQLLCRIDNHMMI